MLSPLVKTLPYGLHMTGAFPSKFSERSFMTILFNIFFPSLYHFTELGFFSHLLLSDILIIMTGLFLSLLSP